MEVFPGGGYTGTPSVGTVCGTVGVVLSLLLAIDAIDMDILSFRNNHGTPPYLQSVDSLFSLRC